MTNSACLANRQNNFRIWGKKYAQVKNVLQNRPDVLDIHIGLFFEYPKPRDFWLTCLIKNAGPAYKKFFR